MAGDTNDPKLDSILALNANLKQVVKTTTKLNPPRMLDSIITTLSSLYQLPQILPALAADPDKNGKPSDHLMVLMPALTSLNNKPARTNKEVAFRPISKEGLQSMENWIETEDWSSIKSENSANRKIYSKFYEFFSQKIRKILSDDEPYFTEKLASLKRKKCRELNKNRRSKKWSILQSKYSYELDKAKKNFYRLKIKNIRKMKPKLWHKELKKTYKV